MSQEEQERALGYLKEIGRMRNRKYADNIVIKSEYIREVEKSPISAIFMIRKQENCPLAVAKLVADKIRNKNI